ncbi:MAG: hypothetical protein KGQ60_17620 [Planctomycetes bacterium]|nr:hypothetical protein [Planctomycetota bacterium]
MAFAKCLSSGLLQGASRFPEQSSELELLLSRRAAKIITTRRVSEGHKRESVASDVSPSLTYVLG